MHAYACTRIGGVPQFKSNTAVYSIHVICTRDHRITAKKFIIQIKTPQPVEHLQVSQGFNLHAWTVTLLRAKCFAADFAGCRLENDRQWDITWANTPYGGTDMQRCPIGIGKYMQCNMYCIRLLSILAKHHIIHPFLTLQKYMDHA